MTTPTEPSEAANRASQLIVEYVWDEYPDNDEVRGDAEKRIAAIIDAEFPALTPEEAQKDARILELERRLRIPFGKFPCAQCGGPHEFDTSIPSAVWNRVIRAKGLPEYLCTTCIVREFARAGEGFTTQLWNEEFNGIAIEFVINGKNANDAVEVSDENNRLRVEIEQLKAELQRVSAPKDEGLEEAARIVESVRLFGHERGPNCDLCIQCQQMDKLVAMIRARIAQPEESNNG